MLPLVAGAAGQQVNGAWWEFDGKRSALMDLAGPKPHPACRPKRHAGYNPKLRRVTVPSDAGAGRVLRHQDFREIRSFNLGQQSGPISNVQQFTGNGWSG